jgi:very-short-patch-repair endonuclease
MTNAAVLRAILRAMGRRRWRGLRRKQDFARELRQRETPDERAAWRILRDRGLFGLKFRRQHLVAGYIPDFYCAELNLVLEIDGGYHNTPEQEARDAHRTAVLEERGLRVVRLRTVTRSSLKAAIRPFLESS